MTTIMLIRHGQTEWNRAERFRGRADIPLNETGLSQAEAIAQRIAVKWHPDAIYTSPLSRAIRTAEEIANSLLLPVQKHQGLVDIDYGRWQGLTPDEARAKWPEEVSAWYNTPQFASIPGGETLDGIRKRAMETVKEVADRHQDKIIILVSHTVVNRLVLLGVLGLPNNRFWHLRQDPCALNVFEIEDDDFTLVKMNDTCHLQQLEH